MEATADELKRYEELQVIALDFARTGKTQDLKELLNSGISVNLCNEKGNSLIMLASYNGKIETTQMLIDFGANVDKKNFKGHTPLAGVSFKGYFEIARILVKAGANIYENQGLGLTPILFASLFGNTQIVEFYLAKNNSFKGKIYLGISKLIALFKKKK